MPPQPNGFSPPPPFQPAPFATQPLNTYPQAPYAQPPYQQPQQAPAPYGRGAPLQQYNAYHQPPAGYGAPIFNGPPHNQFQQQPQPQPQQQQQQQHQQQHQQQQPQQQVQQQQPQQHQQLAPPVMVHNGPQQAIPDSKDQTLGCQWTSCTEKFDTAEDLYVSRNPPPFIRVSSFFVASSIFLGVGSTSWRTGEGKKERRGRRWERMVDGRHGTRRLGIRPFYRTKIPSHFSPRPANAHILHRESNFPWRLNSLDIGETVC